MTHAAANAPHAHGVQPIWNPGAAANWSLLFTPAFGAYLQMKNWDTLGEHARAAESRKWFYATMGMLGMSAVASALLSGFEMVDAVLRSVLVLFLFTWYLSSGRSQVKYVARTFADDYPRRPWKQPLKVALGLLLAYWVAMFTVGMAIGLASGA